jgi:hypothetical protein
MIIITTMTIQNSLSSICISPIQIDDPAHIITFRERIPIEKSPPFDRAGLFFDRDELLKCWDEKNEIVFTGPAGMIWAEDTAGFHRGSTPIDYRLLFQRSSIFRPCGRTKLIKLLCRELIHT